ncbi:MAG: ATP synthase F0 subunit C [Bryobacterales bacterium]|nr:ATP synthase F0 subunit C [Bryobacterales bacterium]
MKKKVSLVLAMLALAAPAFAQSGAAESAVNWPVVAAVIGMAIASAGCAFAQARATAAACEGMARNPGASASIRFALILGLALIESLALYTLVIVFAKVA